MANMFGGGLSVRVTAQTRDFESDIESASDTLRGFGSTALGALGPLQALQGRADEAGDEIADVGRESREASAGLLSLSGAAGAATGGMLSFGAGTEGAGFAVRGLSGSILLTLIPALTVLGSTLFPITAALGGFIAIAGSIAGIGIVGTIAAIATNTEELKTSFMSLISELQSAFAPAIDLATEVLFILMEEFRDIIPALVPAEDTLATLAGAFADLGSVIISNIPAFVNLATTLTTQFLPPFNEWLRDILPQLPGMIMSLVSSFQRMLPRFMEAGRLLADMLPALVEFGFAALNVVGPALGDLAAGFTTIINRFNALEPGIQNLITQASLLAPVLTTVVSILGGISAPVLAIIGAVGLLWKAWQTNFGNIRGVVQETWTRLKSVLGENLPTLIENVKTILDTILPVLEPIFNALIQIAGTVLLNAFDSLVSVLTAVSEVLTGDFAGAWETIEGLINRTIGRLIDLINTLTGGAFGDALGAIGGLVGSVGIELPQEPRTTTPAGAAGARGGGRGGPTQVNVRVEGDTGVIRQVSAETANEQFRQRESRNRRRTGPTVNR